jgi:hypothetical protein
MQERNGLKRGYLGAVFATLLIGGCAKYDASVSGTVSVDGQPLPCGTVMFSGVSQGAPAYGTILADGKYALRTGSEDGLPSGTYAVAVVAHEPPKSMFGPNGEPMPPGKRLTPVKYQRVETSGLQFEVKRGSNQINIDLSTAIDE